MMCVRLFKQMVKQIAGEAMLLLLVIAPVLAGLLFRFGIPFLEAMVLSRFGLETILVPFYPYFNWLLSLLCGMLFAFVGALVVLGEIDDGISRYLCVTPVGANGYLAARIFIPALVSGVVDSVLIPIFSLVSVEFAALVVMVVSSMLSGIITSLLVIALSSNKVEGMAIGKLAGGFGMVLFVPLVVKGPVAYVFSLFPMFWVGKYVQNESIMELLLSLALFVAWIYLLERRFRRKI